MAEGTGGLNAALSLAADGAQLWPGAAVPILPELEKVFEDLGNEPGRRLDALGAFTRHLGLHGIIGALATAARGGDARPVRAIAFDKSPENNWALGWHQDRTICVARRVDVPGYGPWTVKQGMHHVAPPFSLLSEMITLRVHLDAVDESNAPLLIAPGTHRLGKIAECDVEATVSRVEKFACLADAGDVWLYSTPILHASDKARGDRRRRVLQIDYSADQLHPPLEWLGIG